MTHVVLCGSASFVACVVAHVLLTIIWEHMGIDGVTIVFALCLFPPVVMLLNALGSWISQTDLFYAFLMLLFRMS